MDLSRHKVLVVCSFLGAMFPVEANYIVTSPGEGEKSYFQKSYYIYFNKIKGFQGTIFHLRQIPIT